MEHTKPKLIDPYNRTLNYMRVSVTDRCNLQCLYCVPRGGIPKLHHHEILRYEEILRITRIAVGLGIQKIRLTGGEPLVRKGIYDFIPQLTSLPGLQEVSLTTNGISLKENLKRLQVAGIKRINISLDTLKQSRYKKITGFNGFQRVWDAIQMANEMGFYPIKINIVPLKGINDDELKDFAALTLEYPFHIRFIERMPVGKAGLGVQKNFIPNSQIKTLLSEIGPLIQVARAEYDGPAERFRFEGALGEIGFISPLTAHFCETCNRLRLTAEGHLRVCLLSDKEEDLKGPMRNGASDAELTQLFLNAALKKPHSHHLNSHGPKPSSKQMSSIGG